MNAKILRFFSWVTLALFSISAVFAAPAGQITQTNGDVTVTSQQGVAKFAASGESIESGQRVTIGEASNAVIKFQDGQIIALQSGSIFKVDSYKYDQSAPEKGESHFSLLQGGLHAITGEIGNKNRPGWRLDTPTATIRIEGTDFMAVISNPLFVKVFSGAVSVTNDKGKAAFLAGQTGTVANASSIGTVASSGSVPAGTFSELSAIDVAAGGSAAGSTAAAGSTEGGFPTEYVIGLGILLGVAAAAGGGGGGGGGTSSTTGH